MVATLASCQLSSQAPCADFAIAQRMRLPNMTHMTTDEEFASCERSDRVLRVFVGRDPQQTIVRLCAIGLGIICVILATLAFVG